MVFKLLNHAIYDDLNSRIYTGKQASVYHTTKHDGQEFAVKVFKDRDRNTQGHYHSRLGNFKSNSRKIVKTWAENEMRLKAAGIRCPTPIVLTFEASCRSHGIHRYVFFSLKPLDLN
nr:PREDICTED: serine/threonine-protein kinase rio1-like isoform X1 [Daucus carota subsp. sativus]